MFAIIFTINFASLQQSFLQFTNFVCFATIYLISYNLQQICKFCNLIFANFATAKNAKIGAPVGGVQTGGASERSIMLTRFMYGTQEQIDKARRNDKNIVPASVYFNKGTGALILSLGYLEEPEKDYKSSFEKYIEDQLRISY